MTMHNHLVNSDEDASSTSPVRIMIADDSIVARASLRKALANMPDVAVVAAVADGQSAIDRLRTANPDIVLLDIEMPVKSGIDALPELLAIKPDLKVLVISSLTQRNADICMIALRAGAAEVMAKPSAVNSSVEAFDDEVRRKVLSLAASMRHRTPLRRDGALSCTSEAVGEAKTTSHAWSAADAIAIGCSTGGPQALGTMLTDWHARGASQPIFITQHMPPMFTRSLAEHISRISGVSAAEAQHGEIVEPGRIYLAPGDSHMLIHDHDGPIRINLDDGPLINYCRPAVDPMLLSLAEVYGPRLISIILTGMGQDGLVGAKAASAAGGGILVQNEASSVVWGMPGAVAAAGIANEIIPILDMQARLSDILSARRCNVA